MRNGNVIVAIILIRFLWLWLIESFSGNVKFWPYESIDFTSVQQMFDKIFTTGRNEVGPR